MGVVVLGLFTLIASRLCFRTCGRWFLLAVSTTGNSVNDILTLFIFFRVLCPPDDTRIHIAMGRRLLSPRRSGEAHCDRELAVEVPRGPLRSRAGRGGLARKEEKEGI